MATLVQQPDVAVAQVAQLQAIDKPVRQSASLSDFIVAALPVAKAVVDDIQEDTKQRNIALGMNDELNQVTREVSWLDRKYYEQGRDIQTIQTAMVGMDNEVAQNLYQRISDNPDLSEEEALAEYYERNTTAINAIFESKTLDNETKAKMYEAQLQAHAQQLKTVKSTYAQIGLEMEVKGRNARADSFVSSILSDGDVVDGQLALGRLVTSTEAAYNRRQDLDPAKRYQAVQAEIKANLKASIALLRNNTDVDNATNLKLVDRLESAIQEQLNLNGVAGVDYNTWVEADGEIKQLRDDLAKRSEDNFVLQQTLDNADYDAGVAEYTADAFNTNIAKIQTALDSGQITASTATRLINQETALYAKANNAKIGSEEAEYTGAYIVANNMSVQDFNYAAGKPLDSTEEYNKRVSHYYKELYGNTPEGRAQAAIAMIKHSDGLGGKEYNPALSRLGADLLWGGLTQYLTNPQSMNDEQFQRAEAYWALLQEQYNGYMKSQPTRVDDLLGDNTLTESQRTMMNRVLRDGGSLKRAIQDFQRSDDYKGNIDAYRGSVNSWSTKNTGIADLWGNSTILGQRHSWVGNFFADFKGVPNAAARDDIINTSLKHIKEVGLQSDYDLAEVFGVLDGDRAIQEFVRRGMIIPSLGRYNAATVNSRAAKILNSALHAGDVSEYNGKAIDLRIQAYAKAHNVEPSNVFVTTRDRSGQYLHFQHLTKDGLLNDEPKPVRTDLIRSEAAIIYRRERENTVNPKVTVPMAGTVGAPRKGNYGIVGTASPKQETYTYTPNKPIGKLQLTALNAKHKGQKFNVNVPAQAAEMYNGNAALTMAAIQHLGIKEGFFMEIEDRFDSVSGKRSSNGAIQISLTQNPKYRKRIEAAAGKPQELMNIQGDFFKNELGKLQQSAARVGIPVARHDRPYPQQHKNTQLYLLDIIYHQGPRSDRVKAMEDTLTQRTHAQGLAKLKQLPAYKSSMSKKKDGTFVPTARTRFLESALKQHYEYKASRK